MGPSFRKTGVSTYVFASLAELSSPRVPDAYGAWNYVPQFRKALHPGRAPTTRLHEPFVTHLFSGPRNDFKDTISLSVYKTRALGHGGDFLSAKNWMTMWIEERAVEPHCMKGLCWTLRQIWKWYWANMHGETGESIHHWQTYKLLCLSDL
jgi:hypothetical protein